MQKENSKNISEKNINEDVQQGNKGKGGRWSKTHHNLFMLLFGPLFLLLLTFIILWMINTSTKSPNISIVIQAMLDTKIKTFQEDFQEAQVNSTPSSNLKIISRQEWTAQNPKNELQPLQLPVPYVIISHTAAKNCSNLKSCSFVVRNIQRFHQENKHWDDISYNFLIGGDGNAYDGRGWKFVGVHSYEYNMKSIGIAFIGNFDDILPPPQQITTARRLIEEGVKMGYVSTNYKLLGSRQVQPTEPTLSPGEKLYENLKTWSHWSEKL